MKNAHLSGLFDATGFDKGFIQYDFLLISLEKARLGNLASEEIESTNAPYSIGFQ